MRVLSVVGARPQFVKLAPVNSALVERGHEHIIVHTGQHYDFNMSDVFFRDLGIPEPSANLGVGSASHAHQTAAMLSVLEDTFIQFSPDWVLVYGDTNSTLAAALAAVKINAPIAHLEAGLRSFNRRMPEEHNRILTDHASDLLLPPTEIAMSHLRNEGLANRAVVVGDVMTDVCFATRDSILRNPPLMPSEWSATAPYRIATIHRPENTDVPNRLMQVISYLASSSIEIRVLAHPRLRNKMTEYGIPIKFPSIQFFDPLSYPQLVHAVVNSDGVITDSGGLQKEAFLLGVPCITVRSETEWTETVALGWNTLVPNCDQSVDEIMTRPRTHQNSQPYGSGSAAKNVVTELETWLHNRG